MHSCTKIGFRTGVTLFIPFLTLLLFTNPGFAQQPPPPNAALSSSSADTINIGNNDNGQPADEMLVLQLIIDGTTMQEFVDGYRRGKQIFLPVQELSNLLDFAIKVDTKQKTAQGWFIAEGNTFSLTMKQITLKDGSRNIPPGQIIANNEDIFVDKNLLSQWFPVDFTVNAQKMTLDIETRAELPYQQALWRQKMHAMLDERNALKKAPESYKELDFPYAPAQLPSMDLTFAPSYQNKDPKIATNYSVLAGGDLGYLTSRLFASGNFNDRKLSSLRLTLGRADDKSNLLGPLHASSFQFGDINAEADLPQVTSSAPGRGFFVTNRPLDLPSQFDVTRFVGDSTPGWTVELYRNDALIEYQTVGSDGRYDFENIPVLFGDNVFRLSFYGPQGQRHDVIKTVNADTSLLKKGQFTYDVSAEQKNKNLFGPSDSTNTDGDGLRAVSSFKYGLTDRATGTMGVAHTTAGGLEHNYVTAGLNFSYLGLMTALDGAYDTTKKGESVQLLSFGHFLGMDLRFSQRLANNFVSEDGANTTNQIKAQTILDLGRPVTLPFLGLVSNDLLLTHNNYASGRLEDIAGYRMAFTFKGLNLTNSINYDRDNLGLRTLNGTLSMRGLFGEWQPGLRMDYTLSGKRQIQDVNLSLRYPITNKIYGNMALISTLSGEKANELDNTVTFDMDKYKLSLVARASDNNDYYLGMVVNTSIGWMPHRNRPYISSKPMAETGTISVRPFLDANYNQRFDPGEQILPNAVVKIGGQRVKVDPQSDMAIATQLPVNVPVAVSLDQTDQKNPYLSSSVAEYHITPRPGKVIAFDYPMFETSQLDGTVAAPPGIAVSGLEVDLLNTGGQAVYSTHTAFDGYYLIEGLMPGTYTLTVVPGDLAAKGLAVKPRTLVIDKADFYTRDMTLTVPPGS